MPPRLNFKEWRFFYSLLAIATLGCMAGCSHVPQLLQMSPPSEGVKASADLPSLSSASCKETGPYACMTGETEPLYTFQWTLNYGQSYFQTHADIGAYGGGYDLNIEPVHSQGYKGQGINVLVIDSGVDLAHEDLRANADYSMSWNFVTGSNDPNPVLTGDKQAHGSNVAGIIAAAQNGKGMMGIAPLARIGGVALVLQTDAVQTEENILKAYGGAPWSRKADVINASFGVINETEKYAPESNAKVRGVRSLKNLRDGKGAIYVKAAGNAFDELEKVKLCGSLSGYYDCTNPANDAHALEPNAIVTAALNAKGEASSYSSAGSVVWITGLGGENGLHGDYGEKSGLSAAQLAKGQTGDGPTLFSTDITGCAEGPGKSDAATAFLRGVTERVAGVKDNPNCDYSYMNGTSVAAPTISGLAAVLLSVNPALTWRDIRDILRMSARHIDQGYEKRTRNDEEKQLSKPYNALLDLKKNAFIAKAGDKRHITLGSSLVPVELGWQKNAAGYEFSNWYGFGLPDAQVAVDIAKSYLADPSKSKPSQQLIPEFSPLATLEQIQYQKVSLLAEFDGKDELVDAFQLRLDGKNVCLGSLGIAVESPAGTKSILKMPLDHFGLYGESDFQQYGLGSYAFYGENAKGRWKIYAMTSNPRIHPGSPEANLACAAAPKQGSVARNIRLAVEARVIAQ